MLLLASCASNGYKLENSVNTENLRMAGRDPIPHVIVQPGYPRKAIEEKLSGWVRLEFFIDDNGVPVDIKVAESHPGDVFVKSALSVFKHWKFKSEPIFKEKLATYTLEYQQ